MIVAIYTFQLPKPISREEAKQIFLSTAPKYQGVPGLLRKNYVVSPDGSTAGGIYFWSTRADADALYTESWRLAVREKYGADPTVTYLDSPVMVDNATHEILADE